MGRRLLLIGLLGLSVALWGQQSDSERLARACYARATFYFNHPNQTDYTDSLAFMFYQRALRYAPDGPATAKLRFDSHEKIGIYHQTFERNQQALASYRKAIAVHRQAKLPDSLLFVPYLYGGMVHSYLQTYDSTIYYLEQAEALYKRYRGVPEARKLYNMLGIVYHESGNYRQSINYFQKALQLQLAKKEVDSSAIYSYKSNIATALRNLQQYDSAAVIYKSLLPLTTDRDKLYTNLGIVYLQKHQPEQALAYLQKVKTNSLNGIIVRNALAETYLQQAQIQNARATLNESVRLATPGQLQGAKNAQLGLTYKLLGDILVGQKQYEKAIRQYQQSIIQLDLAFNSSDVYQNPLNYRQGFSSYLLFETLIAKAATWRKLYRQQEHPHQREAAIKTYQSAFRLADYIQKSFDNDEARLFTVQKVYPVYQRGVAYLVGIYEKTGDETYLQEAFRWSEKSKAAVLAIGLKENTVKSASGIPDSLLSRERNLRVTLSRQLLRLENATSTPAIQQLTAQIRDTELTLSRLTDALHDYPNYYRQKFSFDSLSIDHLQRNILNRQTALLSYFRTDTVLFGFVLTNKALRHFRVPQSQSLDRALRGLLTNLQTVATGRSYGGKAYAEALYDKLIRPANPYLDGIQSLVIIPHDELAQLPFETLHDYRRTFLLERFDITYQYAASFLQSRLPSVPDLGQMLSVAPFAGGVITGEFSALKGSERETTQLNGVRLLNRQATKAKFLSMAHNYPIIHLATHAVANNTDPSGSFVAFYPSGYASNRLYAHEISYGMLPRTELVFLSACETAKGKLIQGEGVMSLSRAFSFAGCPNLITSLWKAEDNATAYISSRFYHHLRDGMPFAKALRQAKLDLLHDRRQVQYHSPQYWSHLIFIGTPARSGPSWGAWLMAGLVTLAGGLTLWRWKRPAALFREIVAGRSLVGGAREQQPQPGKNRRTWLPKADSET